MTKLNQLNRVLTLLKRLRRGDKIFTHPLLRSYLLYMQRTIGDLLDCKVAYAGSVALFLHGIVPKFGDFDLTTDRLLNEDDLPWKVKSKSLQGLQVHHFDLDIFFNADVDQNAAYLKLSNEHVVTLDDGLRAQSADYVLHMNHVWDNGEKQRMMIDEDKIDSNLMNRLRLVCQ